jgi:hypothetical protein
MYSDMLRLALEEDRAERDRPLLDLVAGVLVRRAHMREATGGPADRIGDALRYDVALIHLCEHLSIEHEITGEHAGPEVRRRQAEEKLADRLPSLAIALGHAGQAGPDEERKAP